jgi:diguanylate cyclase (GGDEF)-like protein
MMALFDDDGLSVFCSDTAERRAAHSAILKSEQRVREVIELTPAAGSVFHGRESTIRHKQGHLVYVLVNANIVRDEQGDAKSLTAFITDITERKQAEARLERLATHDPLTGLPNRAFLNMRLQMLATAPRDESNGVMFIDLDRFKEVNDSMGHKAGDILLCEVAHRLKSALRPSDIVARLGGDEFVVVVHCTNGASIAEKIAKKLHSLLAAPIEIEGQEVFISGSIGISMFPLDGKTKEVLFQNADTAMYRAKAAGRNCYRFFTGKMSEDAKTRRSLENALRRSIERNQFELHYQPRVNARTLEVTGVEALIRWNHPQRGRVSPDQFIPIAEEIGMIDAIGNWVLENACKEILPMMNKIGRALRLSVNLSAQQLRSTNLPAQIEATLKAADFPPHFLELELKRLLSMT